MILPNYTGNKTKWASRAIKVIKRDEDTCVRYKASVGTTVNQGKEKELFIYFKNVIVAGLVTAIYNLSTSGMTKNNFKNIK